MTATGEKLNQYGFVVNKDASKDQIKNAVEKMYNVNVQKVNTMIYLGKLKVKGTKSGFVSGRKKSFKKAVVHLEKGQNIDFFSNI